MKNQVLVLIPAFRPADTLLELVSASDLRSLSILVVDDGSGEESKSLFSRVAEVPNVRVLHHAVNLGKGAAIKTGLNEALLDLEVSAIVTADADGQHSPKDILELCEKSDRNALVLGVRDFGKDDVPLRSRFGNETTRFLFRIMKGIRLRDTQTGLRFIPRSLFSALLKVPFDRYEFEMEMLLVAIRKKFPIQEIPIQTIYIENNKSSHFNPLKDSFRIYFVFFRFALASLASALLDLLIFSTAIATGFAIPAATFMSRLVSGSFNFLTARRLVFASNSGFWTQALGYWTLAFFLAGMSSYGVEKVVRLGWMRPVPAKLLIETALFLVSFSVQKSLIFSREQTEASDS